MHLVRPVHPGNEEQHASGGPTGRETRGRTIDEAEANTHFVH